MKNYKSIAFFLAVLIISFTLSLVSCGEDKDKKKQSQMGVKNENAFTILAGSELKDIEPFLGEIQKKTGINVKLKYSGTLDGFDRLLAGEKFDAAWFSHAKYLMLSNKDMVKASEKTMLSPVIIGVKESKAREFGWKDNPNVTWEDIAAKIRENRLNFAMTNPTTSNTGFSAVIGVVSAFSKNPDSLRITDIDENKLKEFFKGMKLTSGSSGWLAEAYIREQDRLDAMINYESVLITLNRENKLKEKFTLVYPKEGIITADYPIILLNEQKRDEYNKLVQHIKSPEFQRLIMDSTFRRPVIPDVPLAPIFPKNLIVELPFPGTIDIINAILFSYLDQQRPPAHSIFVLDVSGSMRGQRIEDLKRAFLVLCGEDTSLTGKFSRFQKRERIDIITFDDKVYPIVSYDLGDLSRYNEIISQIKNYAMGLTPLGGTAIFSALINSYQLATQRYNSDPDRYYSIVLMTDGKNNAGASLGEFENFYKSLPKDVKHIKVFPIIFGEADKSELERVAEITGGRVFDAQKDNLAQVFKQIRGYQ